MLRGTACWQRIDQIPLTKGQPLWFDSVVLTKASSYPTHLVLFWQAGEDKPWFLATNLTSAQATLRAIAA